MILKKDITIGNANLNIIVELYPKIGEDKRYKVCHNYVVIINIYQYDDMGGMSSKFWKTKSYEIYHDIDDEDMILHSLNEIENDIIYMYNNTIQYPKIKAAGWN